MSSKILKYNPNYLKQKLTIFAFKFHHETHKYNFLLPNKTKLSPLSFSNLTSTVSSLTQRKCSFATNRTPIATNCIAVY